MNEIPEQNWCMLVVDRLDCFYSKLFGEIEDGFEEKLLEEGWQLRATIEAIKPMYSTLHWPKEGKIHARAKLVGGLLGHSMAHYHALCDQKVWDYICDIFEKLCSLINLDLKDEEKIKKDENPFLDAKSKFDSAVVSAMRHALRQSVGEQAMFFEGYTKALRRGAITKDVKGVAETTRTPAYRLIAVCGPLFRDQWSSVHDVHKFLIIMLGKQRAGEIKRTENVCKSIKMRFRSAGRPSKTELK